MRNLLLILLFAVTSALPTLVGCGSSQLSEESTPIEQSDTEPVSGEEMTSPENP